MGGEVTRGAGLIRHRARDEWSAGISELFAETSLTPRALRAPQLPSLAGATAWINSDPIAADDLRGRVVLVNFWTFTCINWLRQEPYVRAWSQGYRDDGLVVIGVHTPEFAFEHELEGVRAAVDARGIDYPVAVDNDYAIWHAFGNRYWPALYFADSDGIVRDQHFGEGRYEQSERVIQRLVGADREPLPIESRGVEEGADWDNLRSPETYLGRKPVGRVAPSGASDAGAMYEFPERLRLNEWALAGEWSIGQGTITLDEGRGAIAMRFHARDAHLVMRSGGPGTIPFRVLLDGEAPGQAHGEDVDEDGAGLLADGRLYQLTRERDRVRERTLEIEFLAPGAEAYAFTFG